MEIEENNLSKNDVVDTVMDTGEAKGETGKSNLKKKQNKLSILQMLMSK